MIKTEETAKPFFLLHGIKRYQSVRSEVEDLNDVPGKKQLLQVVLELGQYISDSAAETELYSNEFLETFKIIRDNHTRWIRPGFGRETWKAKQLNSINSGLASLGSFSSDQGDKLIIQAHKLLGEVAANY